MDSTILPGCVVKVALRNCQSVRETLINVSPAKIFKKQYNSGKQSKAGVRYERSDNIDGC